MNNHDAEFGNGGVDKFSCSNNSLLFLINNLRNFLLLIRVSRNVG